MNKKLQVPDTLILIFLFMVFAWLLRAIIPLGHFDTQTVNYQYGDQTQHREVLVAGTYHEVESDQVSGRYASLNLFTDGQHTGLVNAPFEGLTTGSRSGGAVGIIAFLLLIGGVFGVLMKPASIHKAILNLMIRSGRFQKLMIPILCLIFSASGAIFGMGEEAIAFTLLLVPVLKEEGFHPFVVVLCCYVSTQVGFATSWMNPFNVAIGQGMAQVPMLSGAGFRFAMWIVFTVLLMLWVGQFSNRTRLLPAIPEVGEKQMSNNQSLQRKLTFGDKLLLLNLLVGLVWIIWGVTTKGYYIAEIASQFFAMAISASFIILLFKVDNLSLQLLADSFKQGAAELLPAALVVGFAQGILALVGGTDPTHNTSLNTILHGVSSSFGLLPDWLAASAMFMFQAVFNFFVTSGSAQAALTMPILAPVADLVDVSRQTAVLAFQLGDGLTNIFVPTSAALMGCLGAAKISWSQWAAFIWKFLLVNFLVAIGFILIATITGF